MSFVDKFKTPISLKHLDFMGHVNNATYLQLMEEARWHLYEHYGQTRELVKKEMKGPIIIETHIKYRKEILLNEMITIETSCLEYRNLLGKMSQIIYKENGKKACLAELVFGMLDLRSRKLIRPQGAWKDIHIQMIESN